MHISGFQNRAWGSLTGFLCGSFRGSVEVYRISGFGAQVLGFRFRFRVAGLGSLALQWDIQSNGFMGLGFRGLGVQGVGLEHCREDRTRANPETSSPPLCRNPQPETQCRNP